MSLLSPSKFGLFDPFLVNWIFNKHNFEMFFKDKFCGSKLDFLSVLFIILVLLNEECMQQLNYYYIKYTFYTYIYIYYYRRFYFNICFNCFVILITKSSLIQMDKWEWVCIFTKSTLFLFLNNSSTEIVIYLKDKKNISTYYTTWYLYKIYGIYLIIRS